MSFNDSNFKLFKIKSKELVSFIKCLKDNQSSVKKVRFIINQQIRPIFLER